MFNPETKQRFISEFTNKIAYKRVCESLFNATSKFESELNKDICAMNAEELTPIAESMETVRLGNSRLRMSVLKAYIKWCIENDIDGACDAINSIETSNIKKVRSRMIASPLHLQEYMNLSMMPESSLDPSNIYRCIIWMAYAGISIDDVGFVTVKDVRLNDMMIRFREKNYPIYRDGFEAFQICVTSSQFIYRNPGYSIGYMIRDRVQGDVLIRGIIGTPSRNTIMSGISRIANSAVSTGETEAKLTYNSRVS